MSKFRINQNFLAAMLSDGLEPDCPIISDGRLHRFRNRADKSGTRNGWYILFPDDPPAGAYGCWKRFIHKTWVGSCITNDDSLIKKVSNINLQIAKELENRCTDVEEILYQAIVANGRHQYLRKKQVGAYGIYYFRGALIIPVRDTSGRLHGIQRIFGDGVKRFSKGTNKSGHFHMIGIPHNSTICIAEGYATASTIHEVTGHAVAVAFDVGNLLQVAKTFRSAFPEISIIICADNDHLTPDNPGMVKAALAAEYINGRLVYPQFSNAHSRGSDFNDLFLEDGKQAVLNCFAGIGGKNV